jgi:hypothetical protein
MLLRLAHPFAFLALLLACGPEPATTTESTGEPPASTTDSTTTGTTGSSTSTTGSISSTTTQAEPATTTANLTSTSESGESSDVTGTSFITQPDVGDGDPCGEAARTKWCDPWSQDCASGDKCTPTAGNCDHFVRTTCTELPPQPVAIGGACVSEKGPLSGENDCELGATCWFVDPDTLLGTCVGLCQGNPQVPTCAQPGTACVFIDGLQDAALCLLP